MTRATEPHIGIQNTDIFINANDGDFTYRAAALIVRNSKLLAVNSTDYPNVYYTVGGRVRLHETSEEAVVREVYEETGAMLEIDRLAFVNERFYKIDGRTEAAHKVIFFYLMKDNPCLDITTGRPTDQSSETLHWLPLNNLGDYNLVPPFLKFRRLDNLTTVEHIISKEY